MLNLKKLLAIFTIAFCAMQVHAMGQGSTSNQTECTANCVSVQRVGASFIVTWTDKDGQPVKSQVVDLPKDAVAVSAELHKSVPLPNDMQSVTTDDVGIGRVEYQTHTYQTGSEYVIITIILVYDAEGNLLRVSVYEMRIPIVEAPRES